MPCRHNTPRGKPPGTELLIFPHIQPTTPDSVVDLRALAECVQDMAMGNLAGGRHMADVKTLAPGPKYARPGSAVEASQKEVAT